MPRGLLQYQLQKTLIIIGLERIWTVTLKVNGTSVCFLELEEHFNPEMANDAGLNNQTVIAYIFFLKS